MSTAAAWMHAHAEDRFLLWGLGLVYYERAGTTCRRSLAACSAELGATYLQAEAGPCCRSWCRACCCSCGHHWAF